MVVMVNSQIKKTFYWTLKERDGDFMSSIAMLTVASCKFYGFLLSSFQKTGYGLGLEQLLK